MKTKAILTSVISLALAALACSLPGAAPSGATQPASGATDIATAASQPAAQVSPTAAQGGVLVKYKNVAFIIPDGVAMDATGESVPAATENDGGPWGAGPAYIRFTFQGYPPVTDNQYLQAELRVYPAAEYAAANSWAAESLKRLQVVIAKPSSVPLVNDTMPNVPFMGGAGQVYAARIGLLDFGSGSGVRMLSEYAQYPAPISQKDSFYHFEGLTRDGKYFVTARLPLILPVWSDASNPGQNGITYKQDDMAKMDPYYQAITALIETADPAAFKPGLPALDALVHSITVTP